MPCNIPKRFSNSPNRPVHFPNTENSSAKLGDINLAIDDICDAIEASSGGSGSGGNSPWTAGTGTNSIVDVASTSVATGNISLAFGTGSKASGNFSVALGKNTTASGDYSHAEGYKSKAIGNNSHAEGINTIAYFSSSHAEGTNTASLNVSSHAEGFKTNALGIYSHAEGHNTTANGNESHAEGRNTTASGIVSHAEGTSTTASNPFSHAEGASTRALGYASHAEGEITIASGNASHAEGINTIASGNYSHTGGLGESSLKLTAGGQTAFNHSTTDINFVGDGAAADHSAILGGLNHSIPTAYSSSVILGGTGITATAAATVYVPNLDSIGKIMSGGTDLSSLFGGGGSSSPWTAGTGTNSIVDVASTSVATGNISLAFGTNSKAYGKFSVALGKNTTASGHYSHAESFYTTASGSISHTEGAYTTASGNYSHAEGYKTMASSDSSHTEGRNTVASGSYSHAEGKSTTASGSSSHAEGVITTASGDNSHTEGLGTIASGIDSHAEGIFTVASGHFSHAEGYYTTSSGYDSHAEGRFTMASGNYSHTGGHGRNPTKKVSAAGASTFNHSTTDINFVGDGAAADHSAILGGLNHSIPTAYSSSVILGGTGITATAAATVYVPNLDSVGKIMSGGTDLSSLFSGGTDRNGIFDASNVGGTVPTAFGVFVTDELTFSGNVRTVGQIYSKSPAVHVPAASSININLNDGNIQVIDLESVVGATLTLTVSNPKLGATYAIKFIQGSSSKTLIFPTTFKWESGTALIPTTTNNAEDLVSMVYDGTNFLASYGTNFS